MALHCLQLYQMQMLTHGCQPGDSLVFHYSGIILPDQPIVQAKWPDYSCLKFDVRPCFYDGWGRVH